MEAPATILQPNAKGCGEVALALFVITGEDLAGANTNSSREVVQCAMEALAHAADVERVKLGGPPTVTLSARNDVEGDLSE